MTRYLTWLLGRLPLGWLQLTHSPGRLAAAVLGVAFANVLVFMQLGFLGALNDSTARVYRLLDADILISASDFRTLSESSQVPRERLLRALTVEGVASATVFFEGRLDWDRPDGSSLGLTVYGVDPEARNLFGIDAGRDELRLLDTGIIDVLTRGLRPHEIDAIHREGLVFEGAGRSLTVRETFRVGPSFAIDGYLVVSDQTFLNLFPLRSSGAPNHVLVNVEPGTAVIDVQRRLSQAFAPADQVLVRTRDAATAADQSYTATKRPTGVVFGFGVIIGVLVGIVIVYQVLATDVAEHLAEYATLKAIGYRHSYFLSVVFEESVILALLGFVPGLLATLVLYQVVSAATGLQIAMNAGRLVTVLIGTIAMCALSGAIATRRLAGADPADLF